MHLKIIESLLRNWSEKLKKNCETIRLKHNCEKSLNHSMAYQSGILSYLSAENEQQLQSMGYRFLKYLGAGGYGAVFSCQWTQTDPQTNNPNVKTLAAKIVKIKYVPDLRFRTPEEMQQLKEDKNITIRYIMNGKEVVEHVKWRKTSSATAHFMIENPMTVNRETVLRKRVENIETELKAMYFAEHRNVIKLENVIRFYDEYSQNPFVATYVIFMELAVQDLQDYLNLHPGITEDEAKQMMAQINAGVTHLHSKGIAHMDLKPENILVFKDQQQNIVLKITDFGLSVFFDPLVDPTATRVRGTQLYRCPELMRQQSEVKAGQRTEVRYDPTKADVWSLAVILLVILFGKANIKAVHSGVPVNTPVSDAFLAYLNTQQHSPQLEDLLKQVFVEQQSTRIDMTRFCAHIWLNDAIQEQNR